MPNNIRITDHAYQRMKERMGLNKKAAKRMMSIVYKTRTVPNGKGYNRNKQKQQDRRSGRLSYNQDSTCRFCYAF